MKSINKAAGWLKWLLPILGLLTGILGITLMFTSMENLYSLVALVGIAMVLAGLVKITSFCKITYKKSELCLLVNGTITTLFGLYILFGGGTEAITYFLAYFFLAHGIGIIAAFCKLNKKNEETHRRIS